MVTWLKKCKKGQDPTDKSEENEYSGTVTVFFVAKGNHSHGRHRGKVEDDFHRRGNTEDDSRDRSKQGDGKGDECRQEQSDECPKTLFPARKVAGGAKKRSKNDVNDEK